VRTLGPFVELEPFVEATRGLDAAGLPVLVVVSSDVMRQAGAERDDPRIWFLVFDEMGLSLVRGGHPRAVGAWPQYAGLGTALRRGVVVSDVVTEDSPWETWEGQEHATHGATRRTFTSTQEYADSHNHYQAFLAEVFNYATETNTVAVYGEAAALESHAGVWGGFFAARSWPRDERRRGEDTPERPFDAQLVGVEVDVLNNGQEFSPGQALGKTGVQIVAFGATSGAALEVRAETTDSPQERTESSQGWHFGVIARNGISDNGTALRVEQERIGKGLDLSGTHCQDGAVVVEAVGASSGLRFVERGTPGAELYQEADGGPLVLRLPAAGLRIVDEAGNEVARF
jgi:hypothetical protein